jgi:hypothetical protein
LKSKVKITDLKIGEMKMQIGEAAGVPRTEMGRSRLPVTPIYYLGWVNELFSAVRF